MLKAVNLPDILTNRNFLKLWLSQVLSQPATHMLNFILAIRVYEITGSNFVVSILVALVSVPPILFSTTAGVLADSLNRKYILIVSNFLRAIIVIGLIFFSHSYFAILIFAFLISAVSVFFGPAETASIPSLARGRQLFKANTLFLFTLYTSFLIGYSLAGPLLYWLNNKIYFLLIIAYILATFMDVILPSLDYHLKEREELGQDIKKSYRTIGGKIKEGLIYIKERPLLLIILFQITYVFSVERAIIVLVPDFAINLLHFDLSEIGYYLIMPIGLGALAGALFSNRLKNKLKKQKIIAIGILIHAIVLILLSLYQVIELQLIDYYSLTRAAWLLILYVVILAFISGMTDVSIIISAQTMLQQVTHHGKRGRVFGNLTMLMNLVGLPIVLLVGFFANFYLVTKIILFLGIITFFVGIISYVINSKKLDSVLINNDF